MYRWIKVVALGVVVFSLPALALSATHRVPSEFATINAALDASVSGDSVLVAPGTYTDYEARPGPFGILISSCAWMRGGVTLVSEAGPESTTIALNGGISFFYAVFVWQLTEEVRVEGFTVTSTQTPVVGAQVLDSSGGATFVDCIFRDMGKGGSSETAMEGDQSDLIVIGCRFENLVASSGGAIACNRDLWVVDSHFENCQNAAIVNFGQGTLPSTVVRNSVFVNNFQDNGSGGAIFVKDHSSVEVSGCEFLGNVSTGAAGAVRIAVRNDGGTVQIRDNVFWDNHANGGGTGGAFRIDGEVIEVTGNTFHACTQATNVAGGAAARLTGGTVTFENNVISQCTGTEAVSLASGVMDTDCNIYWGNTDGDVEGFSMGPLDRLEDPLFCDPVTGDLTLSTLSPCLPAYSLGCDLIGARGQGCGAISIRGRSWGQIKGAYR